MLLVPWAQPPYPLAVQVIDKAVGGLSLSNGAWQTLALPRPLDFLLVPWAPSQPHYPLAVPVIDKAVGGWRPFTVLKFCRGLGAIHAPKAIYIECGKLGVGRMSRKHIRCKLLQQ